MIYLNDVTGNDVVAEYILAGFPCFPGNLAGNPPGNFPRGRTLL